MEGKKLPKSGVDNQYEVDATTGTVSLVTFSGVTDQIVFEYLKDQKKISFIASYDEQNRKIVFNVPSTSVEKWIRESNALSASTYVCRSDDLAKLTLKSSSSSYRDAQSMVIDIFAKLSLPQPYGVGKYYSFSNRIYNLFFSRKSVFEFTISGVELIFLGFLFSNDSFKNAKTYNKILTTFAVHLFFYISTTISKEILLDNKKDSQLNTL